MRVLLVKFQIKSEFLDQFLEVAIADARGSSHDEPGCLRFDVCQDEANPGTVCFYEVYKDDAALEEHRKAPHYIRYRDTISEDWYITPPEVIRGVNVYPPDQEW